MPRRYRSNATDNTIPVILAGTAAAVAVYFLVRRAGVTKTVLTTAATAGGVPQLSDEEAATVWSFLPNRAIVSPMDVGPNGRAGQLTVQQGGNAHQTLIWSMKGGIRHFVPAPVGGQWPENVPLMSFRAVVPEAEIASYTRDLHLLELPVTSIPQGWG